MDYWTNELKSQHEVTYELKVNELDHLGCYHCVQRKSRGPHSCIVCMGIDFRPRLTARPTKQIHDPGHWDWRSQPKDSGPDKVAWASGAMMLQLHLLQYSSACRLEYCRLREIH